MQLVEYTGYGFQSLSRPSDGVRRGARRGRAFGSSLGPALDYYGCDESKGCRGDDATELGVFQGLQRVCNRFVEITGKFSKIAVDGRLGARSFALLTNVLREIPVTLAIPTTRSEMAAGAAEYGRVIANYLGVAYNSTPSIADSPSGDVVPTAVVSTAESEEAQRQWEAEQGAGSDVLDPPKTGQAFMIGAALLGGVAVYAWWKKRKGQNV